MRAFFTVSLLLATAAPALADHTWGIGLRTSSAHLRADEESGGDDEGISMAGGGLQLRWRNVQHWGVELSLEGLHGELAGGAFTRDSAALTVSILWHPLGPSEWDLYFLGGIGGTGDTVTFQGAGGEEVTQEFQETHVHLGVGLEHLWRHFGLGVELRAVGMAREDEEEARAGDAVPAGAAGFMGSITAQYYF